MLVDVVLKNKKENSPVTVTITVTSEVSEEGDLTRVRRIHR